MAQPVAGILSPLFPSREIRERQDDMLTRALADAHERVVRGPVTPRFDFETFRQELAQFDYRTPWPLDRVLRWTIAQLETGLVHVTHPRYFGLFNPAASFPAQCADRIASVFNPQLVTATTSPVAVEIEHHVIHALAERLGLPPGAAGSFTTGGSEANLTALICALTRAHPDFSRDGARAFSGAPVLYVSRECHLAWVKIAHQTGIGRSAVRFVPTDGTGRMDFGALQTMCAADRREEKLPVMIVATAGTTNAGMIDPLADCAHYARSTGIWFHVDAAWGGAAIASERYRGVLSGIELADSVTVDAHKWLATTMGCGMIILREAGNLSAAFKLSADFMPSNNLAIDPYVSSVQWSRRFLGLRLFLSLAAAGWAGYGQHIERSVELIALLRASLAERGWTIANDSSLAVLCFEPPEDHSDAGSIVRRLLETGDAWVSIATFEGKRVIRACVPNGETSSDDVLALVDALERR
jgi:aromatic-L-amino-acid/L-tryptophan decarboxylase